MAYEKQTWKTGDVVTSAKLNHMEDGISNAGGLVVNIDWDDTLETTILDKTWQEIHNAVPFVAIVDSESGQTSIVTEVGYDDRAGSYYVRCFHAANDQFVFERYASASEDGVLALATT